MSKTPKDKTGAKERTRTVNPPFDNDAQAQAAALDGTPKAPRKVTHDVVQPPFDNDFEAMAAATSQKDQRAAKAPTADVEAPPFETDEEAQAFATDPKNKRHYAPNPFPVRDWGAPADNDVVAYYQKVHPGAQKAQKVHPNTDIPESKDTLNDERPRSHASSHKSS